MRSGPIRVVIVDNYRIVSESLDAVLCQEADIDVVATAASVAEAAALSAKLGATSMLQSVAIARELDLVG